MQKDNFVPMAEANTRRIRSTATLPFDMEERIGLHLHRLHTMLQLGGIRHVRIESDADGETSRVSLSIAGMDDQGGAVAGGVKSETVPTSTAHVDCETDSSWLFWGKQSRWEDLKVKLNIEEMKRRILDEGGNVKDPKSWVGKIDRAVKGDIARAGVKHLMGGTNVTEKGMYLGTYANDALIASGAGIFDVLIGRAKFHAPTLEGIIGQALFSGVLWTISDSLLFGFERAGAGRRASLFLGAEVDRALALRAYSMLWPVAELRG